MKVLNFLPILLMAFSLFSMNATSANTNINTPTAVVYVDNSDPTLVHASEDLVYILDCVVDVQVVNVENLGDIDYAIEADYAFYIFHGSEERMSIGTSSLTWDVAYDLLAGSPAKSQYFLGCHSDAISTRLGENAHGFDSEVDSLISVLQSLQWFINDYSESHPAQAEALRGYLYKFVIENFNLVLSRAIFPVSPMRIIGGGITKYVYHYTIRTNTYSASPQVTKTNTEYGISASQISATITIIQNVIKWLRNVEQAADSTDSVSDCIEWDLSIKLETHKLTYYKSKDTYHSTVYWYTTSYFDYYSGYVTEHHYKKYYDRSTDYNNKVTQYFKTLKVTGSIEVNLSDLYKVIKDIVIPDVELGFSAGWSPYAIGSLSVSLTLPLYSYSGTGSDLLPRLSVAINGGIEAGIKFEASINIPIVGSITLAEIKFFIFLDFEWSTSDGLTIEFGIGASAGCNITIAGIGVSGEIRGTLSAIFAAQAMTVTGVFKITAYFTLHYFFGSTTWSATLCEFSLVLWEQ